MEDIVKAVKKFRKENSDENITIMCITLGVIVMSLGVFLVGRHVPYGNLVLMGGSTIFYASIIYFVFRFA